MFYRSPRRTCDIMMYTLFMVMFRCSRCPCIKQQYYTIGFTWIDYFVGTYIYGQTFDRTFSQHFSCYLMMMFQKSLDLRSFAKESVMNEKMLGKKELFCIVVGWELKQGILDTFKALCLKRNESAEICDYALQIVRDCEQCRYDMLGAFQYHNPEMMLSIIDAALYRNVKQLALTRIYMTDDHFSALGKMLATCPLLKEVKLTKNRMDLDCLKRIVNECLRVSTSNLFLYSSLQFLCLNDNFLTGFTLSHIRNLFSFCNKLKVVSLARCSLNDVVIDSLSVNDEFCKSIEKLDVSENTLTNVGRSKVVSLFTEHCSISF